MALDTLSLPVLEPLTPGRLLDMTVLALSCLYAGRVNVIAALYKVSPWNEVIYTEMKINHGFLVVITLTRGHVQVLLWSYWLVACTANGG